MTGATGYYLWVGTTPGGYDLLASPLLPENSDTVTLPINGATVYVRLWSVVNGALTYRDYTYIEPAPAIITSPLNGSALTSTTTFMWSSVTGASGYYLWVGTTPGGYDLLASPLLSSTIDAVNIPSNDATI